MRDFIFMLFEHLRSQKDAFWQVAGGSQAQEFLRPMRRHPCSRSPSSDHASIQHFACSDVLGRRQALAREAGRGDFTRRRFFLPISESRLYNLRRAHEGGEFSGL